jgi:hypothetical protein
MKILMTSNLETEVSEAAHHNTEVVEEVDIIYPEEEIQILAEEDIINLKMICSK